MKFYGSVKLRNSSFSPFHAFVEEKNGSFFKEKRNRKEARENLRILKVFIEENTVIIESYNFLIFSEISWEFIFAVRGFLQILRELIFAKKAKNRENREN